MHLRLPTSSRRAALLAAVLLSTGLGIAATTLLTNLPLPTDGNDFHEPGTQPLTLQNTILDSTNCSSCHGYYDETQEPYRRWASSMMGQAGRDPIFYATLAIANQDAAESGQLCLRCHAPGAFLDGRGAPGDGSALDPAQGDLDGVTCNFCHRLTDPVYQPGISPLDDQAVIAGLTEPPVASPHTGQYVIDPYDRRRGPFDLGPLFGYHAWEQSPYHLDSRLCGNCHDVSNPAFSRQPSGSYQLNATSQPHPTQEAADEFPVERTFSEWSLSDYAKRALDTNGRFGGDKRFVSSCQDCHMPKITGTACIPVLGGAVRPDLPQHNFSGANSWVLSAVLSLYPGQTGMTAASVAASQARNRAMLTAGSDLDLLYDASGLHVRVVNHGGHKLPTGYGEGRRAWVNVRFFDSLGQQIDERGAYDDNTAILTESNTKVYEIRHGLDAYMSGVTGLPQGPSFHFVLNNTVVKDNRIPPPGFTNYGFYQIQDEPVAANYADCQYWDDTLFVPPAGAASAQVRLYHQTTTKEYIEFLQNENTTNNAGQTAYNQWLAHGKSAPVQMQLATIDLSAGAHFDPLAYGLAKRLSGGRVPELGYSGTAQLGSGSLNLEIRVGVPNQIALALWSPNMACTPFQGGTRYVGSPSFRTSAVTLSSTGSGTIPISNLGIQPGDVRNYQVVMRDPGDAHGVGLTNGLHVEFSQ
ncbi:MAG: hypothetical protein IPJ19_12620 [Planctomycetes bacterium]|nr:hypothetical protein [Planctomycetota bacterium]